LREYFSRLPHGLAIADNKIRQRDTALACVRNQFHFRIQREQWRNAIRGRGRVAEVSGYGTAVLDLDTANLPRCSLQSVKASRQWHLDNFGPGGQSANLDIFRSTNYAFELS
jgi:hypothetical protein